MNYFPIKWPPYIVEKGLEVTAEVIKKTLLGLSHSDRHRVILAIVTAFLPAFTLEKKLTTHKTPNQEIDSYYLQIAIWASYIFLAICSFMALLCGFTIIELVRGKLSIANATVVAIVEALLIPTLTKLFEFCKYKDDQLSKRLSINDC